MFKIIFISIVFLALSTSAGIAQELHLKWDHDATIDAEGNPLSPGNEVIGYKIYSCISNTCSLANGTLIGQAAPADRKFNIEAQPRPRTYFVTAFNVSGESPESTNTVRVTPPARSTNVGVIRETLQ